MPAPRSTIMYLPVILSGQYKQCLVRPDLPVHDTAQRIAHASAIARRAVQARDWATVEACARQILAEADSAEGHFLMGLAQKAATRPVKAAEAFARALELDAGRYDAAVELAGQYSVMRRNGEAAALLDACTDKLGNSPLYLDMAGAVYTEVGLPEKAWPLLQQAVALQPKVDLFQANLATCAVYVGKVDQAAAIYRSLLTRFPGHRHNHWQLSRLKKATDDSHVTEMKELLRRSSDPPERNVFLYYAIGKELEDLGQWAEAFEYYRRGGEAVIRVADYRVETDVALIDAIIDTCNAEWVAARGRTAPAAETGPTPIFIVGLPRTGTTLTERIVSSHSQVETLGETQFLQMVLRRESGIAGQEPVTPDVVRAAAQRDMGSIARGYLDAVRYRLRGRPLFIDKLPFNFLFLGFIARAWPAARIVHLHRHPLDACFSMYKQVFTWAYKFSYSLEDLGTYYLAYDRLLRHWRRVLGDRLIEVRYETLVTDQEVETRRLLDALGLPFEEACLDFHRNAAPSATASSVQVREKVYTDSLYRWKRFAAELQPLKERLEHAGIPLD